MKNILIIIMSLLSFNLFADLMEDYYSSEGKFKILKEAKIDIASKILFENYQNLEKQNNIQRIDYLIEWANISKSTKREIKDILIKENKILEKIKTKDSELNRIEADLKITLIRYSGNAISLSMKAKKLYKEALNQNPNNYKASLGLGIWSVFAPRIAGGGSKVAKPYLIEATKSSYLPTQFNSYMWLSQAYFLDKNEKDYQLAIKNAKAIYPNNQLLKELAKTNSKGKVFGSD